MSRYSPDQLKAMATIVLDAEGQRDPRPLHLYIVVAQHTGIQPMEVRERIIALAEGPLDVKA
jgi:hypothetical protein